MGTIDDQGVVRVLDPDTGERWSFDVGFMRSGYRCIYGNGCQGIDAVPRADLHHGCCTIGAQLTDDDDVATVVRAVVRMGDAWQYRATGHEEGFLVAGHDLDDGTPTSATRVVDGACIFLDRPDHPTGPGCSLHKAALAAGERPMDWKPNVCWQVPIRVDRLDSGERHVRAWTRADWGDTADLAWWCTEDPAAFGGSEPLVHAWRDELIGLVGDAVYAELVRQLESVPVMLRRGDEGS